MTSLDQELPLLLLDGKQWRRPRSLASLAKGKRTVATLYWGLRHQQLGDLGIARYLDIAQLDFKSLHKRHLCELRNERYRLTEQGQTQQQHLQMQLVFDWQACFQTVDLVRLKQRLLLLVQVISEFQHQQLHYFVVRTSLREQRWIKSYFRQLRKSQRDRLVGPELTAYLETLPDQTAQVLVQELVGYQNNGLTRDQIAVALQRSPLAVAFVELSALGKLVGWCQQHPQSVLAPLCQGLSRSLISKNAVRTLHLYQATGSLDTVAHTQRIRLSTVQEHLSEVAIYLPLTQFPYEDFVSKDQLNQLISRSGTDVDAWQFQTRPDENLTFFQFRLIQIWLTKEQQGGHHDGEPH
ncbi:helix-turn-helix domain-containing protein [Fructilactobacillus carniphilus]|uniref:Helix-turn-helix domain-containing protein n=1 Tax=Fructilactobacillus carniphilus TaxID=2940297 RepID=A0ABY5C0C8_9LACO|nr:helix-turn-helix domain-containing protein [Fructilactobacillus carniphilus]USS91053.1 helix-turn-helix domain-containing protein [Fructilactobacillus carniphilus]